MQFGSLFDLILLLDFLQISSLDILPPTHLFQIQSMQLYGALSTGMPEAN